MPIFDFRRRCFLHAGFADLQPVEAFATASTLSSPAAAPLDAAFSRRLSAAAFQPMTLPHYYASRYFSFRR